MSRNQRWLVSKIILDKDIITVKKSGLAPILLVDPLSKNVYEFLCRHYEKYGQVPSQEIVKEKFPSFEIESPGDSFEVIIELVKDELMRFGLEELIENNKKLIYENPRKYLRHFDNYINKIKRVYLNEGIEADVSFDQVYTQVLEDYKTVKSNREAKEKALRATKSIDLIGDAYILPKCSPYPWFPFNYTMGGMEPSDYIVYYANYGMCKSWLLLYQGYFLSSLGKKVIFVTREMDKKRLFRRYAAISNKLSYSDFKSGLLSYEDEVKICGAEALNWVDSYGKNFIVSEAENEFGETSINSIESKVRETSPDIVLIDGLYFLSLDNTKNKDRDHRYFGEISRQLKQLAKKTGVIIIGTTQANRTNEIRSRSGNDMGNTVSYLQDADLVLRIIHKRDINKAVLIPKKSREGVSGLVYINTNIAKDFSWVENGMPFSIFENYLKDEILTNDNDEVTKMFEAQKNRVGGGTITVNGEPHIESGFDEEESPSI
jgi:replicative DNA helicase